MDIYQLYETRKLFTKPAGELIEQFFPFDKEQALNFQAGLVALKSLTPPLNFNPFAVRSEEDLNAKLAENNVTAEAITEARKLVDEKDKSGVMQGIPPLGDIAVKLGLVDVKIKNMLMEAQAAVRTLDVVESVEKDLPGSIPSLVEVVFEKKAIGNPDRSAKDIARSFIGKDSPKSLTQIQAVQHLADIFASYIATKDSDGISEKKELFDRFKSSAATKLMYLYFRFFEQEHEDVSTQMYEIADATGAFDRSSQLRLDRWLSENLSTVVDRMQSEIKERRLVGFKPEEAQIVTDLINLRANQARGVQLSAGDKAHEGR